MLRRSSLWLMILLLGVLVSCSKVPRGIIGESKMADIIVDLKEAEAYVEMNPKGFETDSAKLALRESIFRQHGVSGSDYDKALDWYGHNMEVYVKVYDKVIERLRKQQKKIDDDITNGVGAEQYADGGGTSSRRTYSSTGDTADIWTLGRRYMLTANYGRGYVRFDYKPDRQYRAGDRYLLDLKLLSNANKLKMLLAVDYSDGSTGYIVRNALSDGWSRYELQTDSTRKVSRVYGYMQYSIRTGSVAAIDSVMLLRTHKSDATYGGISIQKFVSSQASEPKADKLQPAQVAVVK